MNPGTLQPSDILFQIASNLTGGLVDDLTTAMIAMVTIAFIVFGLDHLKDAFEAHINDRYLDSARSFRNKMNSSTDKTERDLLKAKYRNAIRRAAGR